MDSIEFKPFEFPSFYIYTNLEETPSGDIILNDGKYSINLDRSTNVLNLSIRVGVAGVYIGSIDHGIVFSEDGYYQACDWLNQKKRELAEAICG